MANTVEFCSVLHIECLWGLLLSILITKAPYGTVAISISHVLSDQKDFEKTAGPFNT